MTHAMVKGIVATAVGFSMAGAVAQATELSVWAWDPNFNVAIMNEAGERYTAMHSDVTVKVEDTAKDSLEQKLHTSLASGMTKTLPDIVLIEDYNAQKYLQAYPGAFAAMEKVVDYSSFAPYKVDVMTIGDSVYGIPFDTGVTGMYYRTDILADAGFTAEDLQDITWERFIEIGKVVKEKTGKEMLGNDPNDPGLIRVMMQSAGSWYFDKDGNVDIKNNAALKESLELIRDMTKSGIARPTMGWSEWVGTVNSGQVASITTGVWITGSVKSNPDQSGLWAVAPTPRLTVEGATQTSNLGGSSWYVLNSSENKDAAIAFLNEIYTQDKEFYQKILVDRGAVGSYLGAGEGAAYQTEDAFFAGQKVYSDFSDWTAQIPKVNYGMYTYEADAALSAQLPALLQGTDVDTVLERIEQQLKNQIQ
ncbi:extracellular solute-binding protein [Alginatibacterium sediminis]|uniref:Extracellular solute-binding protein n=1 Tax=Alginatibacterium sediminis TaxID=2164068 RepID=A0A420E782_9ALTE|nr:extracellular solute-binding protein [Alginatibacterium sediminis]RKF14265.1 extracellular solute-binding protein [Alginatibacterium sediminis]